MRAEIKCDPITYTGYDPKYTGKRWVRTSRMYKYVTYVMCQPSDFYQWSVAIIAYNKEYLLEAEKYNYVLPPNNIRARIEKGETYYHFWQGEDHWFSDKEKAIAFIMNRWDEDET